MIIGGGAGGFAAAIRANELKAKTAMLSMGLPLGGTCVNVGCVPSKTLLYAGEVLHLAQHHGIPGIEMVVKTFDFHRIIQNELALVAQFRQEKYEKVLRDLEHVTFIAGKAKFVSPNEVEADGRRLYGERFVIAVGSTANVPPIEGIHDVGFVTHIEGLRLEEQPKELIVVGAGPLGLEFGQMYARFGSKVTILQRGPSIFRPTERELTQRLNEILSKEGITVKTGVQVRSARRENNKKIISYLTEKKLEEVSGEEILIAAGKTPNTKGLGLENASVAVDGRQAIVVNQFYRTSQPHIFAVGDVTSLLLRLEPSAGHEGSLAAENALTDSQKTINYDAVPYTIFTDLQLAGVGLTEEQQMRKMSACACRTVSFADVPRAIIVRRTEGVIKMVINPKTKQIVGVHILAPSAGELIAEAMMLVRNRNTIDDVTASLPVFPTLSEAIKIVALSFTKDISKLSCCV